jgi:hypothetical protein
VCLKVQQNTLDFEENLRGKAAQKESMLEAGMAVTIAAAQGSRVRYFEIPRAERLPFEDSAAHPTHPNTDRSHPPAR